MTEKELKEYMKTSYKVSEFETFKSDDPRFTENINYTDLCVSRNSVLINEIQKMAKKSPVVLDVGAYPGTQAKLLKHYIKNVDIKTVGLCFSDEFKAEMTDIFSEWQYTDLDPFYCGHDTNIKIQYPDQSFDFIYMLEVIEHLITPLPFIRECQRLLKPGGRVMITTPNVSHIGAIITLLKGQSNYEDLDKSPMYMIESEWRGHTRLYAKNELIKLFLRHEMKCVKHQYYHESGQDHIIWYGMRKPYAAFRKYVGMLIKPYSMDQIAIFEKV